MDKQTLWKLSMPALTMSALAFQLLPGSVDVLAVDLVTAPETRYNFFNLDVAHAASSFLPIAGMMTAVTLVLALMGAFSKTNRWMKAISWCALASAALSSSPYFLHTEGIVLRPNVIVTLLLSVVWLTALVLEKKKDKPQQPRHTGRRL